VVKYRPAYVFAGIAVVVVAVIVASIIDPTGKTALPVAVVAPILLLGGVLLYQWKWATSQEKPRSLEDLTPEARTDPGLIEDYWLIYRLLALEPLDTEALKRAQASTMGLAKANIKLGAVIAILPVLAGVMILTGKVPDFGNGDWLVVLPFILAPAALWWVRYMMSSAGESAGSWLDPLGMKLTSMPTVSIGSDASSGSGMRSRVSGASVMEGERHGRRVHIALGSDHETRVEEAAPQFEITQKRGRLVASPGAPDAVARVLEPLGESDRWKKLREVKGGADGIVAVRKVDTGNGWMWDLWLCEKLAFALR
jgi:hypothetical protein